MPRKHDRPQIAKDECQPKAKRQKLTDSQLERKRELDREAQRTIRERTKNHIAHLEGLVESLQKDGGHQVEILIAQLNESRAEIIKLKDALTSIIKISTAVTGTSIEAATAAAVTQTSIKDESSPKPLILDESQPRPQPAPRTSVEPQAVRGESQVDSVPSILIATPSEAHPLPDIHESSIPHNPFDLDSYTPFETTLTRQQEHDEDAGVDSRSHVLVSVGNKQLSISQMAASIISNRKLDGKYWFLAGVLLSHILKTQHEGMFISFVNDEDIAIRAVFEGWSAVLERYPLDRGWQWLKELDETIYFNFMGPAERLMHLRNCRYQFLHQLYPNAGWNNNLPAFFAARPSQQYLEHDPLIEHFPWPSFRERLLFSPRKFATDKFMDALRKNVQFIWNYDIDGLYQKDPFTGLYLYSDLFTKHMMDIKCYTVNPKFFEKFPELKSDIPWNNDPSPLSIISSRLSTTSSSTDSTGRRLPARSEYADDQRHKLLSGYSHSHTWQLGWDGPISPSFIEELQAA